MLLWYGLQGFKAEHNQRRCHIKGTALFLAGQAGQTGSIVLDQLLSGKLAFV